MRFVLALAFSLIATGALAQQAPQPPGPNPIEQKVVTELGQLTFSSVLLRTQIDALTDQIKQLQARIRELEAKQAEPKVEDK